MYIKTIIPLVVTVTAYIFSGCNSIYVKNRAYDLADVITAEVETKAWGVTGRVGPVKMGL